MKKLVVRLIVLLAVAAAVSAGFYLIQKIPKEDTEIATAAVKRGDLEVRSFLRGELRAVRSMTLTAPNLGSQSQITRLAPAGALAKAGDLIIEFDDSERRATLEDSRLELEQAQQNLLKAETDLDIRKSQDDVELVKARFAVERAELENRKNQLVGTIEARKNELSLEEAKRREAKLQDDIKSRLQQREAELAVLRERVNQDELEVQRELRRIDQSRVLAPIGGLVSILENRAGGRGGFGQATPTIREGDQIPAGMAVAQILDLSEMEVVAKVEEVERANLREGQEALITLDALPGKVIKGKIKTLGNTATTNVFRGDATKKFDCILSLDMSELLESVGASPEQIQRIVATAKQNAAQGVFGAPSAGLLPEGDPVATAGGGEGEGGRGRGRVRQGGGSGEGAQSAAGGPGQGQQGPGGGRRGGANVSPEQREQFQKAMQAALGGRDPSSLSQEERREMMQRFRQQAGGAFTQGAGEPRPGGAVGFFGGGPLSGGGSGLPEFASLSLSRPGLQRFTPEQRANATLPSPPEKGSDVDILLRPGLLTDAEIIVEQLSDALYVPFQGIYHQGTQPIVYLKKGDSFETRKVELGLRSESQIAVRAGLEEGELIALSPPNDEGSPAQSKKKAQPPQQSFPGAGSADTAAPAAGGGRRRR